MNGIESKHSHYAIYNHNICILYLDKRFAFPEDGSECYEFPNKPCNTQDQGCNYNDGQRLCTQLTGSSFSYFSNVPDKVIQHIKINFIELICFS